MSTFFSSGNQKDVTPSLYPRDTPYPDSSIPGNMLYLSYPSTGQYSEALSGSAQSQQNCIQLPIPATMVQQDPSTEGGDLISSRLGEHAYNTWRDGRSEMMFMQTVSGADDLVHNSVADDTLMSLHSHLGILNGQNPALQQSNLSTQGLSLSLSTQIPVASFQYGPGSSSDICFIRPHQSTSGNGGSSRDDDSRSKNMNSNSYPYGLSSATGSVLSSKFLKAAQQLLDEVVNVRKALKHKGDKSQTTQCNDNDNGSKTDGNPSNPQESTANSSNELSPSERQDLQNKVAKLLAMLDEVDQRYKQYYHQMQIVVSSFDSIAGCGAAKPYTALALQTISRHFRCLRDAISGQIRVNRKSLGEQESTSIKGVGISRLRFIDQHLRQQRAMQQFGMMQPHAWRPQRGLPETSVSILRAWLFEHFLHPYPKDSEKLMLARQTGLTRSQVSNWFINARVRLWKPMIEDMYKEEAGDAEIDSNSSSENAPKTREEAQSSEDHENLQSPSTSQFIVSSKSNLIHGVDMGSAAAASGFHNKEGNAGDAYMSLKIREQRMNGEDCSLLQDAIVHVDAHGRFMTYQMAELGAYGSNEVSLTLGLQHCDGGIPGSDGQQGFMPARGEDIYGPAPPVETEDTDYDYMNMGGRQHRFGPSHLLHDFVA